jgi:hypothetical protein
MGLLNTYFIATDDVQAQQLAERVGGPEVGLQSSGLTPLELDTLLEALTGRPYEEIIAEPVRDIGELDEQWLFEVRPALVSALVGLDGGRALDVATRWVSTEELAGADSAAAAAFIADLAVIAGDATRAGCPLYGWISL